MIAKELKVGGKFRTKMIDGKYYEGVVINFEDCDNFVKERCKNSRDKYIWVKLTGYKNICGSDFDGLNFNHMVELIAPKILNPNYCSCSAPNICETGFGTLVLKVCKDCKKEIS